MIKNLSQVSRRQRVLAASGAAVLLVGTLSAFAFRSDGYAQAQVDLSTSSVWTTKTSDPLVGRVNYQIKALDSSLGMAVANFDIVQSENQVLVVDRAKSVVQNLDIAAVALGAKLQIPQRAVVGVGHRTVSIADPATGKWWVGTATSLAGLDPATTPATLTTAPSPATVVSLTGKAFAVAPGSNELWSVSIGDTGTPIGWTADKTGKPVPPAAAKLPVVALGAVPVGGASPVSITTVGDVPVVLDSSAKLLIIGQQRIPVVDGATLQQPGPAATSVMVSTSGQLLAYPLAGGAPVTLYDRGSGVAVAPVVVDGCAYAAWNSGSVVETVSCNGAPAQPAITLPLAGQRKADPVFRVNRNVVVLNDRISGTIWAVQKDLHLVTISNWDEVKPQNQSADNKNNDGSSNQSDQVTQSRANCAKQGPSKSTAAPAKYTVRAGRSTLLPVLNFVTAGDCAAVQVDAVKGMPAADGSVATVLNGQQVQITTAALATGVLPLTYTIDDGVNPPISARLDVTVIPAGAPPGPIKAIRVPTTAVEINGSVSYNVLTDYGSSTGDDLYLADAQSLTRDDTVQSSPDGQITFSDKGLSGTGKHYVQFTVTDGTNVASGKLTINVLQQGAGKLTAGAATAASMVGVPVQARPLQSVLWPGSGALQLTGVTARSGDTRATATVNKDGSVVLTSASPGSHYFTYAVTANDQKATGVLRFDVTVADPNAAPIATADVVYLPAGDPIRFDPTANDVDPNGLGLAIQQLGTQSRAQLSITDADMRTLEIAARGTLLQPTGFTYAVSNGNKVATGQIRVIPVPALSDPPLPVAEPITLAVRAGDAISLPVAQFASDPRGEALTPTIVTDPSSVPGVLFATKTEIRYLAPATAPASAVKFSYSVTNTSSQSSAAATVTLNVTSADPANDSPPAVPATVTARVLAGRTVAIPLPVNGIDPDGDWVTLTSVAAPDRRLGTAAAAGLSSIAYTASPALHGIDSLSYTASDPYGKSATGTVRIIVVPAPSEVTPPVAPNLTASVRPGKAIAVRPLDSGVSGENVKFDANPFDPSAGWQITRDSDALVISAPGKTTGTGNITYHVIDDRGQTASGVISVTVSATAPLLPPTTQDVFVTKAMVTDGANASVDVSNSIKNNNGTAAALTLGLAAGSNGTVSSARTIKIPLTASRQVLAYTVTDGDQQVATAFVVVPSKSDLVPKRQQQQQQQQADQPPTPKPSVQPIIVRAGASVTRQIRDFVTVDPGKSAQIPAGQTLQAGQGTGKRDDASTFTYTASTTGSGADSLSVPVSVGTSPVVDVPVPIQIIPNAPHLSNGQLAVEVGTSSILNLSTLVDPNYPGKNQLSYGVTGGAAGFQPSTSGGILTVAVGATTVKGTQATLTITATDSSKQSATAQVTVTASGTTKPLPTITDQTNPNGRPGVPTPFSVLNGSTDPFGQGLTVVSAAVVQGKATVSRNGPTVSVTPSAGQVGTITVQFSAIDGTKDPTRQVTAKLTLVVKDQPHPPGVPTLSGAATATSVTLTWDWQPTYANGGTMKPFVVSSSAGTTTCPTSSCQIKNLTPGQSYQFTVTATNEIGSTTSTRSAGITPDAKPDQPQPPTLRYVARGAIDVNWKNPTGAFSSITSVTLVGNGSDGSRVTPPLSGVVTSAAVTGLSQNVDYTFTVAVANKAGVSVVSGPSTVMRPSGSPMTGPENVQATFDYPDPNHRTIGVTWTAPTDNGGEQPTSYEVRMDGTVVAAGDNHLGLTATIPAGFSDGPHSITVVASNSHGPGPVSNPTTVVAFTQPQQLAPPTASTPGADSVVQVGWQAAPGSVSYTYEYSTDNGTTATGAQSGLIGTSASPTLTNGTSYVFHIRACLTQPTGGSYSDTVLCGIYSNWSSPAAVPYTPPPNPSVIVNGTSQTQVGFTWSPPTGTNGRPIDHLEYRIDGGAWNRVAPGPGSVNAGNGCNQTHAIGIKSFDTTGASSGEASVSGVSQACPPPPTVTVVVGASAVGHRGTSPGSVTCTAASCHYYSAQVRNFPPNTSVSCTSVGYTPPARKTDGNGNVDIAPGWYSSSAETVTCSGGGVTASGTG